MERQISTKTDKNHHHTNRWIKNISQWLVHQAHNLWTQRNHYIHDKTNKKSTMDHVLNDKIRQLYSLQNQIRYYDRDLFAQPLEERLHLTTHQKMTWVTNTTRTMKVSMEEFAQKQTTGQRDIRQFFQKRKKSQ